MQIEVDRLVRAKRRTIAIIIERDGSLTVRAPKRATAWKIESFIHKKADWILRTREKIKSIAQPRSKQYIDGETFLFLGHKYELKLVKPQRPALKFENGFMLGSSAQKRGEQVFTRWYKEQALKVISERVEIFARQHGFTPKQVKITSAKTRWGSCSPNGALNFTWRLVMAPLAVIDYVVVHELAHLRVKDHSKKFWKAVDEISPEYRTHRKWLRDHGHTLNL